LSLESLEILKSSFGYDTFRPLQHEAINAVLSGKDTFVVMPTGGGKSICFQVPALILPHLTVVISPLISLMQDQVETLNENGIEAAFYNSTLSSAQKNKLIQQCLNGNLKLLYMAPETFLPAIDSWLKDARISLLAIDEAHCVSTWGHDFRPEYSQLGAARHALPEVPCIALTATADVVTRKDIVRQLHLQTDQLFISSFDRPNLELIVKGNIKKKEKIKQILGFIEKQNENAGIIYCFSRKEADEWTVILNKEGYRASAYHAGLKAQDRSTAQQQFIHDETQIICATIAFGMGIDKSNVRWIIHNNLPKNIESYYQEIGRAGRDGLPAQVLLYYTLKDVVMQGNFIKDSEKPIVGTKKLQRMLQFAEATSCRRKILLNYFNEQQEQDCGNCDICMHPPDFVNGTRIAQMALSGIKRTQERVATTLLIKILRGAESSDVTNRGFHQLKTHGVGAAYSEYEWQHYIAQLINLGLIEIAYDEYLSLKITHAGNKVLFGKSEINVTVPPQKALRSTRKKNKPKVEFNKEVDPTLFDILRTKRTEIAKKQGVPPYIVFNDATLTQMASSKPITLNQMADISGVGDAKLIKYGPIFLELIKNNN